MCINDGVVGTLKRSLQKSLVFLSKIFMGAEPFYFLFFSAMDLHSLISTTGNYWKICRQYYGHLHDVDCSRITANPLLELRVQKQSAYWTMYSVLGFIIPITFIGPIFGALGDIFGRKPIILLANAGTVFVAFVAIIQFGLVDDSPLILSPLASALISLTGSMAIVPHICQAYIVDVTADKDTRTIRMSVMAVIISLAHIISNFAGSPILRVINFAEAMLIPLILWAMSFAYALAMFKAVKPCSMRTIQQDDAGTEDLAMYVAKPKPVDQQLAWTSSDGLSASSNDSLTLNFATTKVPIKPSLEQAMASATEPVTTRLKTAVHITKTKIVLRAVPELFLDVFRTLRKRREGKKRGYIIALLLGYVIISMYWLSLWTLIKLYVLKRPIAWKPDEIAFYKGVSALMTLVGVTAGTVVMKKLLGLHETTMLIIAVLSIIAKLLMIGFATNSAMIYAASAVGVLGDLAGPICASFLSQLVPPHEVGKVFSMFALAMDIGILFSSTVFNIVYAKTVQSFPGFVFIFVALLMSIALGLVVWVHIDYRHAKIQEKNGAKDELPVEKLQTKKQ